MDSTPILNSMIANLVAVQSAGSGIEISFAPNCDYYFYLTNLPRDVQGNIQSVGVIPLVDIKDLTLTGNGARLHFVTSLPAERVVPDETGHVLERFAPMGLTPPFYIEGSERVAIKDLTLRLETYMSEGSVFNWNKPVSYVSFGVVEQDATKDDPSARQVRIDPRFRIFLPEIKALTEVNPDNTFKVSPVNQGTSMEDFIESPLDYTFTLEGKNVIARASKFHDLVIGARLKISHQAPVGDMFFVTAGKTTSKDITLKNISLTKGPSRIGLFNIEKGLLVDSMVVDSEPLDLDMKPLNSGFMIVMQSDVIVRNSYFSHITDDMINVRPSVSSISGVSVPEKSISFPNLLPGYSVNSRVCFFGGNFGLIDCQRISAIDKAAQKIFLDDLSEPAKFARFAITENSMTKRVHIFNNNFVDNDGHLRVRANNVGIERNSLTNINGSAIIMNANLVGFTAGGSDASIMRNIFISNNKLQTVASDNFGGAITVNANQGISEEVPYAPIISRVAIMNNEINGSFSPGVYVSSSQENLLCGNKVSGVNVDVYMKEAKALQTVGVKTYTEPMVIYAESSGACP